MWKEAIQTELNSLAKREVFGPVVHTPKGVIPVGYKWIFVRKHNENNEILLENTMKLRKVSCRDLVLIMRKLILQ